MKLENAKISMLINREYTEITIKDGDAAIYFVKVRLTPDQLSAILSRQAMVSCECEVGSLNLIGKKHENTTYEFEIGTIKKDDEQALYMRALQSLSKDKMSEWEPDKYFRSQNSFFTKEGKNYARCTIRRWV